MSTDVTQGLTPTTNDMKSSAFQLGLMVLQQWHLSMQEAIATGKLVQVTMYVTICKALDIVSVD